MHKFWLIALAVLGVDQATKLAVHRLLEPGVSVEVAGSLVRFTYVLNPGGAFGILGDRQPMLLAAGLLALVVLAAVLPRIIRSGYVWPAGLFFGGALGNLVDRVRCGQVVDFIDVGFWPVFNTADVALVTGAALLLLSLVRLEGTGRRKTGGRA